LLFIQFFVLAFGSREEMTSVAQFKSQLERVNPVKAKGEITCSVCIQFMDQALNLLIKLFMQVGIGGGCSAICGLLDTNWEAQICFVACEYVGIEEFFNLVNDADPDPIWICMEVGLCDSTLNAKGSIRSITSNPSSGPTGATFNLTCNYQITSATGVGQAILAIFPPESDPNCEPFGWEALIYDQQPGMYALNEIWTAQPTEEVCDFAPGVYQAYCEVCEGTCGSSHSYSYTIAQGAISFNITNGGK